MKIKQFEIWTADLNPRIGTEPGKIRPVLIIQTKLLNTVHPSTIVCPITKNVAKESTAHLDNSKTYVGYCDGISCNASTKDAFKLSELGFRVKELMGGLECWKREGYETHGSKAVSGNRIACICKFIYCHCHKLIFSFSLILLFSLLQFGF
jgi:mRNA-degrading endonuclease toxin of MazEF toxin-antitoxin module